MISAALAGAMEAWRWGGAVVSSADQSVDPQAGASRAAVGDGVEAAGRSYLQETAITRSPAGKPRGSANVTGAIRLSRAPGLRRRRLRLARGEQPWSGAPLTKAPAHLLPDARSSCGTWPSACRQRQRSRDPRGSVSSGDRVVAPWGQHDQRAPVGPDPIAFPGPPSPSAST